MKWNDEFFPIEWSQNIINYDQKMIVANKLASFVKDGDVIGFGSGSTSYLATLAISKRIQEEKLSVIAIPTSNEIQMTCNSLGIRTVSINDEKPDWSFDGADEVSPNNWLIKGRGGAMFNEKLIMTNAPKTYIIVDESKLVDKLCTKFPVPVECVPAAYKSVVTSLYDIGAKKVTLRTAGASKDGPVLTENGNYILDVFFDCITDNTEKEIKSIVGVLESGLFIGYNVQILRV